MSTLEMGQLKFISEAASESLVIHIEGSINEDLVIEKAAELKHAHIIFDMQNMQNTVNDGREENCRYA